MTNVPPPPSVVALRCLLCGREYRPEEATYTCHACGPEGILEVLYDYDLVRSEVSKESLAGSREMSLWRYRPFLPVAWPQLPPLQVGWTPLYPVERLRQKLGLPHLYIKDDGRNPTASLKDRASAVGIVKALEAGARNVACASSGNAAASWAGAAASVGLPTYIFVPQRAPRAKVAQLLVFGATVFLVKGSYDQAFDLCIEACERFGWYNRNTAYNPYLVEGKKTVALEIAEQLGWEVPDKVIVAVGDGCIISGVWKGFWDLYQAGFADRLPQLVGVQAEGSPALKLAFEGDGVLRPVPAETIADSISVSLPRNGVMALRDVKRSGGRFVAVSDEEILRAIKDLAESSGIFAEPAAAAAFAAVPRLLAEGQLRPDERVVVIVSGNGLKDVDSAMKAVGQAHLVEPQLEAVAERLRFSTN